MVWAQPVAHAEGKPVTQHLNAFALSEAFWWDLSDNSSDSEAELVAGVKAGGDSDGDVESNGEQGDSEGDKCALCGKVICAQFLAVVQCAACGDTRRKLIPV